MDELIEEVTRRTGLPADKARSAAEAVLGFLKAKLPEPASGMVAQYMTAAPKGDLVGQATKAVEGFFKKG